MYMQLCMRDYFDESSRVQSNGRGKRKGAETSNEDKKDDTRSYFSWNLEMERVLANVLRDQRNLGRKADGGWKAPAFIAAAEALSTSFNVNVRVDNVRNRVKVWHIWYGIVSDILSQSGFDWDGTKYMITVENEDAWNEYVKSHTEASNFRYKVILNWDDIVDLCAKDRANGNGAETALDANDMMSKEANEDEAFSVNIDLEEPSSATKTKGASTSIQSQKRKIGEKDAIISSMKEVANSLKDFVEVSRKRMETKYDDEVIEEAIKEVEKVPGLDDEQQVKAIDWFTENPKKLSILKAFSPGRKRTYIMSVISKLL